MATKRVSRRSRGRPRQGALTRESVLALALALIDHEGIDGLTMRRLAEALNVSPMALYNHFKSKKDLLRSMAEHVTAQVDFSSDHPDWRERIRFCFRGLRSAVLSHPSAVRLMESLDEAPLAIFRPLTVTLQALEEAGLTGTAAMQSYFLLTNFTLGQVSYEVRGPFDALDPAKALASGQFRGTGAAARIERAITFERWDFDHAFEFGLSTILAGLERIGGAERT